MEKTRPAILAAFDARRRRDASRPEVVEELRRSPLTYLLGGDPGHLLDTLVDTPAWDAIRFALRAGGALAGSSAGAMVACETLLLRSPNPRPEARHGRVALQLMPGRLLVTLPPLGPVMVSVRVLLPGVQTRLTAPEGGGA